MPGVESVALSAADPDANLYDGVFYCVKCGVGAHLMNILSCCDECYNCGSRGFISAADFNLKEIIEKYRKEL